MATGTIAVVGMGDMGSAVAGAFLRQGYRVVTDLTARSSQSRQLAELGGIEDLKSLVALVRAADIVLSIVPPAVASDFARRVAAAMREASARPAFVDCNAVSPATVRSIAELFAGLDVEFLDVGIVGPAPRTGIASPTRFYVSGAARARLLAFTLPEIAMVDMGPDVGRASAIKMAYAAMNKGVDALYTAVLLAAERLGVRTELMQEFKGSQTNEALRMARRIPYLAAAAARYVGEMREIASTFASVDVTPDFHRGAEWLYAELARTSFASETRATLPKHRSLDEAIAVFSAAERR